MTIHPHQQYPLQTAPPTADYPYGAALHGRDARDRLGTPLEAAWLSCFFGSREALLAAAGMTPSGEPDSAASSDVLQALRKLVDARMAAQAQSFDARPAFVSGSRQVPGWLKLLGASRDGRYLYGLQVRDGRPAIEQLEISIPGELLRSELSFVGRHDASTGQVSSVSLSPDGQRMHVLGSGTLRGYRLSTPWQIATAQRVDDETVPASGVSELQFADAGQWTVAYSPGSEELQLRNVTIRYRWRAGTPNRRLRVGPEVSGLALAPGRDALVYTRRDRLIQAGLQDPNAAAPAVVASIPLGFTAAGLGWGHDGRRLFVGGEGRVYQLDTMRLAVFQPREAP